MLEWDVGLCVFSDVDEAGFIGIQVDLPGEAKAGAPTGEHGTPYGMFARPHDPGLDTEGQPIAEAACGNLHAFYGDRLHVWPQTDPRVMAKLPRVKKGGAVFYGGKLTQPAFLHIDGDSGGLDSYWPYDFTGDTPSKSMAISVDLRNAGAESISWTHGEGMMFSMAAGGKRSSVIKNAVGDGRIEMNDDGCVIDAAATMITGGVSMGNPTAAIPVALATPLLAYFTALEAVLTTVAGATLPPTAPVVAAFQASTAALKATIAATLVKGF